MRLTKKFFYVALCCVLVSFVAGCCTIFRWLPWCPQEQPQISVNPTVLEFGTSDNLQIFSVFNSGQGTLNWTATTNRNWIGVNPTHGMNTSQPTSVTVTIDRSSIGYGNYNGQVEVNSDGGTVLVSVSATKEPEGNPFVQAREGDNCSQNNCGGAPYERGKSYNFRRSSAFENDEARSLKLFWLPVGAKIKIYDDPDGRTNDDWTEILIKKTVAEYCVKSFENSYQDVVVTVTHHHNNGLNGKVSHLKME